VKFDRWQIVLLVIVAVVWVGARYAVDSSEAVAA
jgi:hypothetical protein